MSDVIYYKCFWCGKSRDVNYCNLAPDSSVEYFGDDDSREFLDNGWVEGVGYCPAYDQDLEVFWNPDHKLDWLSSAARHYAKHLGLDPTYVSWSSDERGDYITYAHFKNIGRTWKAVRYGLELIKSEDGAE
jgi:hypothetical protein